MPNKTEPPQSAPSPPSIPPPAVDPPASAWTWLVCVVLLLGTVVNYLDRLTVNVLALDIQREFQLNDEQYGYLELGFGLAFAGGSIFFGWLVDRLGPYWLYPTVLVGWSAMGFLTGLSRSYGEMLALRILLGFFEAGHFPCGLKTIQILLAPRDRPLGNSLLQSGTALGAIIAPQVVKWLSTSEPGGWRLPFLVLGAGGCSWVVLWLGVVRPRDLAPAPTPTGATPLSTLVPGPPFLHVILTRRFLALAVMVVCINLNWHLFRVWLPKFLQEARGYDKNAMLNFTTFYYVAADVGAIGAGALSGWLTRRMGYSVFAGRMWVFAGCCLLTTLTTAASFLPKGSLLLTALLLVACGGLGTYAAYYSLTQDLSREHQGKVSGLLSTTTWLVTATFHPIFGWYLDLTRDYDYVIAVMGWLPAVSLVVVLTLWRPTSTTPPPGHAAPSSP
jgi:ACS family hexuronate transporter-like MFS transporter